jgi:nucleotide-binding universal stress UspA family protein
MNTVMTATPVAMRNILVATDFSEFSECALGYAAEIARRYSAIVHLLHVVTPDLSTEALAPQALPADIDLERQAAADQLQSRAERLTGIQHKTWLEFGYVLDVVKNLILAQHIDLIVVGTHGRSGFKKLVLGSVAEAIFREAACPVLTVGPKARDLVAPGKLRHILYPVEPLEESHLAVNYAVSLAERNAASLTLLHVLGEKKPDAGSIERINACRDLLLSLIPEHAQLPSAAECRIEFSKSPSDLIVKVAQELPAHLVVMDVRREVSLAAHLSDTASKVVTGVPCPVLTVNTVRRSEET